MIKKIIFKMLPQNGCCHCKVKKKYFFNIFTLLKHLKRMITRFVSGKQNNPGKKI